MFSNTWASSWIEQSDFFLFLWASPLFLIQLSCKYYICTVQSSSLCVKWICPVQTYSVGFPSRAKRTTALLLRGSALSSSGCGSPPAAPWEWWWPGRRGSSLASLRGSTWLRHQGRGRQKETHDEAFLSGGQVTGLRWAEHPVTAHFQRRISGFCFRAEHSTRDRTTTWLQGFFSHLLIYIVS